MQKQFDSILDFVRLKDKCLFCREPLRARLTNFVGVHKNYLPVLNVPINDMRRFKFKIKHTTQSYDILADATIDIVDDKLVFTLPANSKMPFLDQLVTKQAFIDLKPYIDLYCGNKKCKREYSLCSFYMNDIKSINGSSAWRISSPKLFMESFATNNFFVQNDWFKEDTIIYSKINEDAKPLRVPFIKFEEMSEEQLVTRIRTLVTFS